MFCTIVISFLFIINCIISIYKKDEIFISEIYGYYLENGFAENFFQDIAPNNRYNEYLNTKWKTNVKKFFDKNKL